MREKAEENWRVGTRCLQEGDANAAASRLYYAVFQAVLMWARAKKNFPVDRIREVHGRIQKLIRDQGKGTAQYRRPFADLRAMREIADYQPDPPAHRKLEALLGTAREMMVNYMKWAEET